MSEEQELPENRRSASMKKLWKDPEWRAKRLAKYQDPAYRENQRVKALARGAEASKWMKDHWADPEWREQMLATMQEEKLNNDQRRKSSREHMERLWADPEWRAKMLEKLRNVSPEESAARSLRILQQYEENPEWNQHANRAGAVKGLCAYCGKPGTTRDHVVPTSRGGDRWDPENIVVACRPCNSRKRNLTGDEYRELLELEKVQKEPRHNFKPETLVAAAERMRENWKDPAWREMHQDIDTYSRTKGRAKNIESSCVYCGAPGTVRDHVIPPARGGSRTDPENIVSACRPCNSRKGNLTGEEYIELLRLRKLQDAK